MNEQKNQEIALFRYQVIASLLSLEGPRGSLRREITRLSGLIHSHPIRGAEKIGFGTIEEWYYLFKRSGFDGLIPNARTDRGKSRKIDDELGAVIRDLVESHTRLDGPGILAELRSRLKDKKDDLPSLPTLYRFLKAEGLDWRQGPQRRDHRAYSFDLAGDCWQGDVMVGPKMATSSIGSCVVCVAKVNFS